MRSMDSWRATGFLICDRDRKWTKGFRRIVEGAGVRIVLTPAEAPNANAYAERFVRSIREECLDRLILFGERRLLRTLDEFVAHYHGERNHPGVRQRVDYPRDAPLPGYPRSLPRAVRRTLEVLPSRGLSMGGVFGQYGPPFRA